MTVGANPAGGQDNTATPAETKPTQPAGAATPPAPAATAQPAQPPAAPQATAAKAAEPAKPAAEYSSILANEPAPAEGQAEGGDGQAPADNIAITMPDGMQVDAEAMGALKEVAKAGNLTREQAQQLADAHSAAVRRYEEYRVAEGTKTIAGWENEIKTHPEFGGVRLQASLDAAKNMLQKYGSPRLMSEFRQMGVLSHPEFAFMLMRMSKDVSEHQSIGGAGQATPEKNVESILFPNVK